MKKLIVLSLLFPALSFAHVPSVVEDSQRIEIKNPEVSQAFYGELAGSPATYVITSKEDFELYASLLLPDLEGVEKAVQLEVRNNDELLYTISGDDTEWTRYWEQHAGDWYLKGPEIASQDSGKRFGHVAGVPLPSGEYVLTVTNSENSGKYVLVTGNIERFGPAEIAQTIYNLPQVKVFFEKSPLKAFETPTTFGFLVVTLLFLSLVGFALFRLYRYFA